MVDGWDHPSFSFYLCTVKKKVGHTASERRVLGSKSNFSPGASRWFSMWSSLSSLRSSNPSTTAILFPPRYLPKQESPHVCSNTTQTPDYQHSTRRWGLLTVCRASAGWRDSPGEWCCCSAGTNGWGWRQSRGCECVISGYHTGTGQRGFYTWKYHPGSRI